MHHYHKFSPLSYYSFLTVIPWCICYSISSVFTSVSFNTNIRAVIPCFTGTTLAYIIDSSLQILDICPTIFYHSNMSHHTLCIIIGIRYPSESFYTYPNTKITVEIILLWVWYCNWRSCPTKIILRVDNHFWGSGFYKYLQNGHAWFPTSLIYCGGQWCLQVVHNQQIWGVSFSKSLPNFPWENECWCLINPCLCHNFYIFRLHAFLWYWGFIVENSSIFYPYHSCFHYHR